MPFKTSRLNKAHLLRLQSTFNSFKKIWFTVNRDITSRRDERWGSKCGRAVHCPCWPAFEALLGRWAGRWAVLKAVPVKLCVVLSNNSQKNASS